MTTDQITIELNINNLGQLQPKDTTDYSTLTEDDGITTLDTCAEHVVLERVVKSDGKVVTMRWRNPDVDSDSSDSDDLDDWYTSEDPIDLAGDGWYLYYKVILPTEDHPGNNPYYAKNNKIISTETGKEVEFDVMWENRHETNNIFSSAELEFFSIWDLVECFVLTERDRLNEALKNGCDLGCDDSQLALKANFLAAAVFILMHYVQHQEYNKAESLLNRIEVCNGLCKHVKKQLKGCGCYESI